MGFAEEVVHVAGTEVAFFRKGALRGAGADDVAGTGREGRTQVRDRSASAGASPLREDPVASGRSVHFAGPDGVAPAAAGLAACGA